MHVQMLLCTLGSPLWSGSSNLYYTSNWANRGLRNAVPQAYILNTMGTKSNQWRIAESTHRTSNHGKYKRKMGYFEKIVGEPKYELLRLILQGKIEGRRKRHRESYRGRKILEHGLEFHLSETNRNKKKELAVMLCESDCKSWTWNNSNSRLT